MRREEVSLRSHRPWVVRVAVTLNDCRQSGAADRRCELSQGECVFSDESGSQRDERRDHRRGEAGYPYPTRCGETMKRLPVTVMDLAPDCVERGV